MNADQLIRHLDTMPREQLGMYAVFGIRAMYPRDAGPSNYTVHTVWCDKWQERVNGTRDYCIGWIDAQNDGETTCYIVCNGLIVWSEKGDEDPLMWTQVPTKEQV
jgi:hypothetical protein